MLTATLSSYNLLFSFSFFIVRLAWTKFLLKDHSLNYAIFGFDTKRFNKVWCETSLTFIQI